MIFPKKHFKTNLFFQLEFQPKPTKPRQKIWQYIIFEDSSRQLGDSSAGNRQSKTAETYETTPKKFGTYPKLIQPGSRTTETYETTPKKSGNISFSKTALGS